MLVTLILSYLLLSVLVALGLGKNPEPDQVLFVYFVFCLFFLRAFFFFCALYFRVAKDGLDPVLGKIFFVAYQIEGGESPIPGKGRKIIVLTFCLSLTRLSDSLIFCVCSVPESK